MNRGANFFYVRSGGIRSGTQALSSPLTEARAGNSSSACALEFRKILQVNTLADCCNEKACEIEALRSRQSATLKIVLGINAVVFLVELTAGILSGSVSLLADSLDMLWDALVHGFSLYVVARGARMKAQAALLKGGIMAALLHRSRSEVRLPAIHASRKKKTFTVELDARWLAANLLTAAELRDEIKAWNRLGIELSVPQLAEIETEVLAGE